MSDPVNEQLRQLDWVEKAQKKWEDRLLRAIANREHGWHRLAVKLDNGRPKVVQVLLDEEIRESDEPYGAA